AEDQLNRIAPGRGHRAAPRGQVSPGALTCGHRSMGRTTMGRRFTTLIGVGAVALTLTAASLALAGTATAPVKILGGRGSQELPAGAPGNAYLSWTQFRAGHINAYLRPLGQTKILLNRRGYG